MLSAPLVLVWPLKQQWLLVRLLVLLPALLSVPVLPLALLLGHTPLLG